MTHYWCQIVLKCEYLISRGFDTESSFFSYQLGDLRGLRLEGAKRRQLGLAIATYDDVQHLLGQRGIVKVNDMRSTEKVFGYFRTALAAKIAD